jgi:FlaA1/EpsC-like NDP-sugar epimerase
MSVSEEKEGWIDALILRYSAVRVFLLFLLHAIIFAACYGAAFLVRFDFDIPKQHLVDFEAGLPWVVGVQLVVGAFFGFYRGWWRYVGMAEVIKLVIGLSVSLAILVGIWYADLAIFSTHRVFAVPRGVLLTNFAFTLLALFGSRVVVRVSRDHFRHGATATELKRVLIIGAGDAGETLAREIEHRPSLGMKVVAFVDDRASKLDSSIRGITIVGPIGRVAEIAEQTDADEALIAIPSAPGKRIREIMNDLAAINIPVKTIPGIDQLVSGKVQVTQLRPVNIEDLLRRERIELPDNPVKRLFAGKRVLLTGAGGTIGSELATQILEFEPESLHLVERNEFALYTCDKRLNREKPWLMAKVSRHLADIRDCDAMIRILAGAQPQIVVHAAAHKHVPLGEENPPEYIVNNALATRTLAEHCDRSGVERFVFISTDKAINPTSVMGATKRAAEIVLLDLARVTDMKITAVRFGNVLGSSGSVVPLFMEQIAAGGPITVTHPDVTRYFLRTSEAISLVLQAATLGSGGSVFMLDMGEPIKIAELARDLLHLSNLTEDEIPIVFTGLRPGEKLFEELRLDGETNHETEHPQIVVTEAPQPDPAVVAEWMRQATKLGAAAPEAGVIMLRQLIPEYEPAVIATPSPMLTQAARTKARKTGPVLVPLHTAEADRVSH